jgi:hypothetical protein
MSFYNDSTKASMHITASSNLIIAFVIALYVALTWGLVSETRKLRKLQTEPNVFLYLEPRNEHKQLTDLFIENTGLGPAYSIKFDVITDFMFMEDDEEGKMFVSNANIVKRGIKYLAPHQKKRIFSTAFYEVREFNSESYYEIKIEYEVNAYTKKKDAFPLSFFEESENRITMVTDPFEKRLLEAVNKIEGHMLNIFTEMGELDKAVKNRKE